MRRSATILAFLALLSLLLPPPAAAQAEPVTEPLVVAPRPPSTPLRPLLDQVAVPVDVRLNCALRAGEGGPVNLTVSEVPEWLVASPPSQEVELPEATECDGGYVTAEATVAFQATASAPAGESPPMRLAATRGVAEATANLTLTVGAFVIVEGVADSPVRILAPGDTADVQLTVTNFGNTPVEVAFGLVGTTAVDVVLPDAVTLQPRTAGAGNSTTVPVSVRAPATPDATHQFQLRLTPAPLEETNATVRESTVGLIVHVKGEGLLPGATSRVPAGGAAWVALAAAVAAVAARRLQA